MYIHGVNLSLTEEQGLHHVYTWWNFVQIFYFIFLSRFSVPLLLASLVLVLMQAVLDQLIIKKYLVT